ncbi:hypothetical protein AALB51_11755 [Lachnospiraceae bacterium 62-26]
MSSEPKGRYLRRYTGSAKEHSFKEGISKFPRRMRVHFGHMKRRDAQVDFNVVPTLEGSGIGDTGGCISCFPVPAECREPAL